MKPNEINAVSNSVAGYVLAGGRSARMGRDKALVELAGRPLIEIAVGKLRGVCAEVYLLAGAEGAGDGLAAHAPLVYDLHPGCGPLGGIEAALGHSAYAWSLIVPVDMPFLPAALLEGWVRAVVNGPAALRIAIFSVDGRARPAPAMLHREVGPLLAGAVARGEFGLLAALEAAGMALAERLGEPVERVLRRDAVSGGVGFANVNSPEELGWAEGLREELEG